MILFADALPERCENWVLAARKNRPIFGPRFLPFRKPSGGGSEYPNLRIG
jgi:hypothetical protein